MAPQGNFNSLLKQDAKKVRRKEPEEAFDERVDEYVNRSS